MCDVIIKEVRYGKKRLKLKYKKIKIDIYAFSFVLKNRLYGSIFLHFFFVFQNMLSGSILESNGSKIGILKVCYAIIQ